MANEASIGRRLGRYQLDEAVGGGPVGEVWRAKATGPTPGTREFAVKIFHSGLVGQAHIAAGLAQVARNYSRLDHARIARLQEFSVVSGDAFTATEWVKGLDWSLFYYATWGQGRALPMPILLHLLGQVARAVGFAHGRGIPHLGLCPTNVFCLPDGEIKLTDFGLVSPRLGAKPMEDPSLDGRLPFLAPEQLCSEPTSLATDVFGLAVLGHFMLCGRHPFMRPSNPETALAMTQGEVLMSDLPKPLRAVFGRSLSRSPLERYPDASAFADALDAAMQSISASADRREIIHLIQTCQAELQTVVAQGGVLPKAISCPPTAARDKVLGRTTVNGIKSPTVPVTIPPIPNPTARGLGVAKLPTKDDSGPANAKVSPYEEGSTGIFQRPDLDGAEAASGKDDSQVAELVTRDFERVENEFDEAQPTVMRQTSLEYAQTYVGQEPVSPFNTAVSTPPPFAANASNVPAFATTTSDDGVYTKTVAGDNVVSHAVRPPPRPSGGMPVAAERSKPNLVSPPDEVPASLAEQIGFDEAAPLLEGHDTVPGTSLPEMPGLSDIVAKRPLFGKAKPLQSELTVPVRAARSSRQMLSWVLFAVLCLGLGVAGYLGYGVWAERQNQKPSAKVPATKTPMAAKASDSSEAPATANDVAPSENNAVTVPPSPSDNPPSGKELVAGEKSDRMTIETKPPGAQLYLNGTAVGKSPQTVESTGDEYRLAAILPGYRLVVKTIPGSGKHVVNMEEVSPPGGQGGIKVRCKTKNRFYVFLDGADTGQLCPSERIEADVGKHTIEIYDPITDARRSFKADVKQTRRSERIKVE